MSDSTLALPEDLRPQRPSLASSLDPVLAPLRAAQAAFNRRPLRERALMIGIALTLLVAAADQWLLGPAFQRWREASQRQDQALQAQAELQAEAVKLGRQGSTRQNLKRAELNAWRQRVRDGEAALRSHEDTLVGPGQMMNVLERLLASHSQVRVRSVRQLDRVDLLAQAASAAQRGGAGARAAAPASGPATERVEAALGGSLYRHGVELQLEGTYADLLRYVKDIEGLPQALLWGPVSLEVLAHPTCKLTLRLYTVSRDRHWLEF